MNLADFIGSLVPNLVSEAVGILTTVLIVDRLLSWREKRRWRCVRKVFLAEADKAIDTIIDAWKSWITVLGKELYPTELIGTDVPAENWAEGFAEKLGNFSCYARKCEVNYSFFPPAGVLTINDLMRGFTDYAEERLPYLQDPGWSQLHKEMKLPVQKLNDLVDRYAMLVDPRFALPVIRLSEELDNLKSGKYEKLRHFYENGNRLAKRSDVNEEARKTTATLIDSAIRETLGLKYYVRRNLGKEVMESPFERVARVAGLDPVFDRFKKRAPSRSTRRKTVKVTDQPVDPKADVAWNDVINAAGVQAKQIAKHR